MNLTGLLAEIFPNGSVLRKSGTTVGRELSEKSHTREPGLLLNTMVSSSSPPCCFIASFSSLLLLGHLPPTLQAAAEMLLPPGSLW